MGYESNYHLQTIGPDAPENKAVLDEIETASGYHFEREDHRAVFYAELEDARWYDYKKHCAAVAKRHPQVYIEVNRDGENRDDNEITRFHGDLQETIVSETSWPPFRNIILPAEQAENPFFLEAESIRPLLNIATWRHVLGVIFDHRIDDGSWPPAEERLLDVLLHIVDDIDSSDESLIREWYNGNEDVLIPDRLDGFEEAKATWVRPWREAIDEITRRVGAGEVTAWDALMALTVCDNSYTPVRGNHYVHGRHTYASLADLVVSVGCSYARSQRCDDCPELSFLKSYIKKEEDERD